MIFQGKIVQIEFEAVEYAISKYLDRQIFAYFLVQSCRKNTGFILRKIYSGRNFL